MYFEIWSENGGATGPFMYLVNEQNDVVRRATMPNAVLAHSFTARSNFEAFRIKHKWAGFGAWSPEADWEEHFFDEHEASDQREYLRHRVTG